MTSVPDEPRVSPTFSLTLTVGKDAIDELGHASNIAYVRWVQDVAKTHSERVGWDHAKYVAQGAVFVVRRYELDYLGPAFEGDALRIDTFVSTWSAASSIRKTKIVRGDAVLFTASTLWAFVSTDTGRPTRIPAAVRDAFASAVD